MKTQNGARNEGNCFGGHSGKLYGMLTFGESKQCIGGMRFLQSLTMRGERVSDWRRDLWEAGLVPDKTLYLGGDNTSLINKEGIEDVMIGGGTSKGFTFIKVSTNI